MLGLWLTLMVSTPIVTMATTDNCTINDRSLNVLEKLVKMTKDLNTCPGEKEYRQSKAPVAFYATLRKSLTLTGSQTVVYDIVYTNFGTSYDVKSGFFKAPITGLYFFTATLMSNDAQMHNILVKNGNQRLSKLFGNTGGHMGSTSAVIEMSKDDTMSVQHHPSANSQTLNNDEYCSFAGYLISAFE